MSATATKAIRALKDIPKSWTGLTRMHPLRPIHDNIDLENATEIIDAMAGHNLTEDQDDYLDSLSTLVATYEEDNHPIDIDLDGIALLRSLIDDHQMKIVDLADLLGIHRSHASKILKKERQLTTTHLGILSKHFLVSSDLFID